MNKRLKTLAFVSGFTLAIMVLIIFLPTINDFVVQKIKGCLHANFSHGVLIFFLTFLTVNPLMIGYAFVVVLGSFIFGWVAFPICYSASVLGAWVWFALTRWLAVRKRVWVDRLFLTFGSYSRYLRVFQLVINRHSFKLAALLQSSFVPYGILNSTFALTELSTPAFLLACCLSRIKLLGYVYLALQFQDMGNAVNAGFFSVENLPVTIPAVLCTIASLVALHSLSRSYLLRMEAVHYSDEPCSRSSSSSVSLGDYRSNQACRELCQCCGVPVDQCPHMMPENGSFSPVLAHSHSDLLNHSPIHISSPPLTSSSALLYELKPCYQDPMTGEFILLNQPEARFRPQHILFIDGDVRLDQSATQLVIEPRSDMQPQEAPTRVATPQPGIFAIPRSPNSTTSLSPHSHSPLYSHSANSLTPLSPPRPPQALYYTSPSHHPASFSSSRTYPCHEGCMGLQCSNESSSDRGECHSDNYLESPTSGTRALSPISRQLWSSFRNVAPSSDTEEVEGRENGTNQ